MDVITTRHVRPRDPLVAEELITSTRSAFISTATEGYFQYVPKVGSQPAKLRVEEGWPEDVVADIASALLSRGGYGSIASMWLDLLGRQWTRLPLLASDEDARHVLDGLRAHWAKTGFGPVRINTPGICRHERVLLSHELVRQFERGDGALDDRILFVLLCIDSLCRFDRDGITIMLWAVLRDFVINGPERTTASVNSLHRVLICLQDHKQLSREQLVALFPQKWATAHVFKSLATDEEAAAFYLTQHLRSWSGNAEWKTVTELLLVETYLGYDVERVIELLQHADTPLTLDEMAILNGAP